MGRIKLLSVRRRRSRSRATTSGCRGLDYNSFVQLVLGSIVKPACEIIEATNNGRRRINVRLKRSHLCPLLSLPFEIEFHKLEIGMRLICNEVAMQLVAWSTFSDNLFDDQLIKVRSSVDPVVLSWGLADQTVQLLAPKLGGVLDLAVSMRVIMSTIMMIKIRLFDCYITIRLDY